MMEIIVFLMRIFQTIIHLWMQVWEDPFAEDVDELTSHLTPLLDQSKQIVFVDPYFRADKKAYLKPLEQFLKIIQSNPNKIKRTIIAYHHNDGDGKGEYFTADEIKEIYQLKLKTIVPNGVKLSLFKWPHAEMHNRYVLTDIMGVSYGNGLSESSNSLRDEDEINPLDKETYKERYEKYNNEVRKPYLIINNENNDN